MDAELTNPHDLTVAKFLALFNQFSRVEQVQIARTIWEKTFAEQWQLLDEALPDADVTEGEVLEELMAVRYGKATKQ